MTAEEREALADSDADIAAGRTISLDPYFEAAQKQQRHRTERCGAEGGSDGGQTRT